MTVDYEQAMAWFESRRPSYEALVDATAVHVPADGVVFDVGANIGYFTKMLVERTGFTGTAHLFEPVPNLADLCEQTAQRLPCAATVHRVGLSDETTRIEIFVAGDGNLGWNTLVAEKASQHRMATLDIGVSRFDDLGLRDVPDFVKIDVEGAEYRVLGGMMSALERWSRRPVILCEIGWGQSHPAWDEELAIFDRLSTLSYEATQLDGGAVDLAALRETTDVLFVPSIGT